MEANFLATCSMVTVSCCKSVTVRPISNIRSAILLRLSVARAQDWLLKDVQFGGVRNETVAIALLAGVAAVAGLGHAASAADLAIHRRHRRCRVGRASMSALMSAPRGRTSRPDQSTIRTEFSHPATSAVAPRWVRLAAFRPVIIGNLHPRGSSVSKAIFRGPRSPTNEAEPRVSDGWSAGWPRKLSDA